MNLQELARKEWDKKKRLLATWTNQEEMCFDYFSEGVWTGYNILYDYLLANPDSLDDLAELADEQDELDEQEQLIRGGI